MLQRRSRRVDAAFALAAVAGLAALAVFTPEPPAASDSLPDLYIEMPAKPYNEHVAPIFVDPHEFPGRVLYRFDTVVRNRGGVVDIWRDPASGHVMQAIWPNGVPSPAPDPNTIPAGKGIKVEDRSSHGARFEYVVEPTHEHFHFQVAASYELLVPGGTARRMPKVGFCLQDTYFNSRYYREGFRGSGTDTWCAPEHPEQQQVRMGLSPEGGDLYDAATELQWIDVTGLDPGRYTIRAVANPGDGLLEGDRSNNVLREKRTIPGVMASPVQAFTRAGEEVRVPLVARVVAPEIPARESGDCRVRHVGETCIKRITRSSPIQFSVSLPAASGLAELVPSGRDAALRYTPADYATGAETLTYTATDARGLASRPVPVRLTVTPGVTPARWALVRQSGRSATLMIGLRGRATIRGRVGRRALRARRLSAGSRRVPLGRLAAGSHTLRVDVRAGARRQTLRLRFRLA